ncbi:hypothetical protein psyc5s11_53790 [Clostridium gelidum]|uniref:Uncharacterized protein n=1 Tax=Clostridium gelidum TaxID=704125 RepID=A0ABM7TE61_9CLOT|nr:DUF1492 domain-containing protein [Clostridium gelidum]BCZ49312.1 hypothetical protein psyc5s11_53790 [Clostridium gelidum]
MDQKEIRRLTTERLNNINVISAKLNHHKRNLEAAQKLEQNQDYIKELKLKILEYETELINIKNAIESLESLEDREKQVIILTLVQKLSLTAVINQANISSATIYRIKNKAIDAIGEILYC